MTEVDRKARDQVASAIAAYMRGEIDNLEFQHRTLDLETEDVAVRDVAFGLWFMYDDFKHHPISVTAKGWDTLRRTIAFLKSDIPDIAPGDRLKDSRDHRGQILRGLLALASIVAAIYLALTVSRYWLLLPGLVVGVPLLVAAEQSEEPTPREPDDRPFFPFATEREWLAHAARVDEEHLPDYEPPKHNRRLRHPAVEWAMWIPSTLLFVFVWGPLLSLLPLLYGKDQTREQKAARSVP
jgi:hypothetical protein